MSYRIRETRHFASQYRKLHDNVAADVDNAVDEARKQPSIGERKKGDLADLYVYKFSSQKQPYLLGYTVDDDVRLTYLKTIGPRENTYRNPKR